MEKQLEEQRRESPLYPYRRKFFEAAEAYQVLVVYGKSECGKTTQISQYLHEAGYTTTTTTLDGGGGEKKKKIIGCTLPRGSAASMPSVAARVAQEMGVQPEHEVAYSLPPHDFDSPNVINNPNSINNPNTTSTDVVLIKYMTDGMLVREILYGEADLESYSVVIVDDAHERTLSTDILLGLLRQIARIRPFDFKLLISCASEVDDRKFRDYFDGAPTVSIPGGRRTHVRFYAETWGQPDSCGDHYLDALSGYRIPRPKLRYMERREAEVGSLPPIVELGGDWDYLDAAVVDTLALHWTQPPGGHILVLLPSQEQIQAVEQRLKEQYMLSLHENQGNQITAAHHLMIISCADAMYANSTFANSSIANGEDLEGGGAARKVLLATSINETYSPPVMSLTNNNFQYVIDSGLCMMKSYDPTMGVESSQVSPISKASAVHRAVLARSLCIRMYTHRDYFSIVPDTAQHQKYKGLVTS